MVPVRFIVVFVWEAFALWSHLLKHITNPFGRIMEMKYLLLGFLVADKPRYFSLLVILCIFEKSGERQGERGVEKHKKIYKYMGVYSRLTRAGICEPITY